MSHTVAHFPRRVAALGGACRAVGFGMPAGLDGNPNPVVTAAREGLLAAVAERARAPGAGRVLVGIDGRSGAGKSTFADELAARLALAGAQVVRSTTDSFHRPRSERMRRGPTSPDGYYLGSHQLDVITGELLEPFAAGASRVLVAAFDEPTDKPAPETLDVNDSAVLLFDGLFLQRPEFEPFWNLVVFLDADRRADEQWLDFLLADLPTDPSVRATELDERLAGARWPRYRAGWARYVEAVGPHDRASVVVDNNDFATPRIVRTS